MRALELLATKPIAAVLPVKVVGSNSNAGKQYRFRLSFLTSTFQWLFEPLNIATAPRASVEGSAETGLLIQFTRNSGFSLKPGKDTVAIFFIAKNIDAVEDRVMATSLDAYLVQFDDGSRALVTEPLPEAFVPRARRKNIRKTSLYSRAAEFFNTQSPAEKQAAPAPTEEQQPRLNDPLGDPEDVHEAQAFDSPSAADILKSALVEEAAAAPEPAPATTTQSLIPMTSTSLSNLRSVDDLKALIHMFNESVNSLRDAGADIKLRIDENGQLRGNLQVILTEEL